VKAYVLHGIDSLCLEDVKKPDLKPNEVLVEIKATGICGSDIPRIYRTGTYSYPLIPGHEFSGIVSEMGSNTDQNWIGKRVGVFPLIPCMNCDSCRKQKYELCRNYSYLGSRINGGVAENAAVPEWNLIELPENVPFEAAAMLEPMAVAVHGLRSVKLEADDITTVCGLGTIGLLLTMFLIEQGIKNILVVGNKNFQKEMVKRLGLQEGSYCDSRATDLAQWIIEKTNGKGADVFFECVGKNETIRSALWCTAPEGTVQLVGNPASDICLDKNSYWKILRNQLTVKGSWNSSFTHQKDDDWHYVLDRLANGKIFPEKFITQAADFNNLETGLHIIRDKREEYIKVMAIR